VELSDVFGQKKWSGTKFGGVELSQTLPNKADSLICCRLCGDQHTLKGNNGGDLFLRSGIKNFDFYCCESLLEQGRRRHRER
jgi:hypothetical protein